MQETRSLRKLVPWFLALALCGLGSARATTDVSVAAHLKWDAFLYDLEELYRPAPGGELALRFGLGQRWQLATHVGLRQHGNRPAHGSEPFEDPGLPDAASRELGPADDLRIVSWGADFLRELPWKRLPEGCDLSVSLGLAGYSLRWAWDDGTTRRRTDPGLRLGLELSWERSSGIRILLGGMYHAVASRNAWRPEDLYHFVDLRLGILLPTRP
jgi:hypothetical protein